MSIFIVTMLICTAPFFGILMIFWKQLSIEQNNWYWWALGVFACLNALFFLFFGCKRRKAWSTHLEIAKNQK